MIPIKRVPDSRRPTDLMSIQIDAAYKAVRTAALQCARELEGTDTASMSLHDVLIADFFSMF